MAAGTMELERLLIRMMADTMQYHSAMDEVERRTMQVGYRLQSIGGELNRLLAPLNAIKAESTQAFMEFQSSFTGVEKTVDAAPEVLEGLKKEFLDMADTIPVNVNEINRVAEAAGQLGIPVENIRDFTEVMLQMGVATNMTSEEAATSLAQLANITQMNKTEFDRLGATIVALGNNGASTEKQIVDMGLRIAGAGKVIGLAEHQTLAIASALASVGIEAQLGGSAISRTMLEINSQVLSGGKNLQKFADVATGGDVEKFTKMWKKDASAALVAFVEGLGALNEGGADVKTVLKDMGLRGTEVTDVLLRASGAGRLMRDALEIGAQGWEQNSALTGEAAKRYATLESQLQITKNQIYRMRIEIGEMLVPSVMRMNQLALDAIQVWRMLSQEHKQFAVDVGKWVVLIGPALVMMGRLTAAVGGSISQFRTMLTVVGSVLSALGVMASSAALPFLGIVAVSALAVGAIAGIAYSILGPKGLADAWTQAQERVAWFWDRVQGFMLNFSENMRILWDWLKTNWWSILGDIGEIFLNAIKVMPQNMLVVVKILFRMWVAFQGWFHRLMTDIFNFVFSKKFIAAVIAGVTAALAVISSWVASAASLFSSMISALAMALREAVPLIKQALYAALTGDTAALGRQIALIGHKMMPYVEKAAGAIGDKFKKVTDQYQKDYEKGFKERNLFKSFADIIKEESKNFKSPLDGLDLTAGPEFNFSRLQDNLDNLDVTDPLDKVESGMNSVSEATEEATNHVKKLHGAITGVEALTVGSAEDIAGMYLQSIMMSGGAARVASEITSTAVDASNAPDPLAFWEPEGLGSVGSRPDFTPTPIEVKEFVAEGASTMGEGDEAVQLEIRDLLSQVVENTNPNLLDDVEISIADI